MHTQASESKVINVCAIKEYPFIGRSVVILRMKCQPEDILSIQLSIYKRIYNNIRESGRGDKNSQAFATLKTKVCFEFESSVLVCVRAMMTEILA